MAAGTVRTRAYFDAEDAGLFESGYKPTQQNYTDWLTSMLFNEDFDVVDGVPQLRSDVAQMDVTKLYPGATPTAGHVIKVNTGGTAFEIGAIESGTDIDGTAITGFGTDYNVGWVEDTATAGLFSPFAHNKYQVKTGDYTVTLADAGSVIIATATATITLPSIDATNLSGLPFTVVSASGTTTINAGSGQTLQGYVAATGLGMDEIDSDLGSGVLTNFKYITFAMPASGTTWQAIDKGDWGTPIPVTKTLTVAATTLTVDASRWQSFTTNFATTGVTLAINNMRDTSTFTIAKTGAGTITTWPANTYFSGTVANAAAVPWTSHDLITVEKKGTSYYVDVINQSAI